ncbi:MAG: O-antigen ligase family protein [Bacillota bacterium]
MHQRGWPLLVAATALLPAFFLPIPAVGDFFYLPKVLLLLGLELMLAGILWRSAWRERKSAGLAADSLSHSGVPLGGPAHPLLQPILLYWAVLGLATLRSVNPMQSLLGEPFRWEGLMTFLLYGGLALLVPAVLVNPHEADGGVADHLNRLLGWGLGVAVAIVAYGVLQSYGLDPLPRDPIRSGAAWWRTAAFATLGNSNFFGTFSAVYLALSAIRYLTGGGPIWLAGAGAMHYGMLVSLSRGSWLAGGLALLLVLLLSTAVGQRPSARRLGALALILVALTLVWRTADLRASQRVQEFAQDVSQQTGTVGQRLWMWQGTWRAILARPWLGYGPDTLGEVFPQFEPPGRAEAGLQGWTIDRAHNDYLQVAVSSGLLGLAAYVGILLTAGRLAWRVATGRASPPLHRALAWSLGAGALAHLLAVGANLSTVSESPAFWSLLGCIAALAMDVRRREAHGRGTNGTVDHRPDAPDAPRREPA